MQIVSDSCQCSACMRKYHCQAYILIVSMQKHANQFLKDRNNAIRIVFQVEECKEREVRGGKKQ